MEEPIKPLIAHRRITGQKVTIRRWPKQLGLSC